MINTNRISPYFIETLFFFRCNGCEAVLQSIELQITKANQNKENNIRIKQQMEQEVNN